MPGRAGSARVAGASRRSPRWRSHRRRSSARRRRRCARPRPACRTNSGTPRCAPARSSASSMVWPSTKCEPSSRIAWRVAAPHRRQAEPLDQAVEMVSGVSPGWMTRAVMPSVQAEAETRKRVRMPRPATSRRRRACPRSGGRRWRHRARAAAPRPAPSGRAPPWWTANRRAGNPRCRRARRPGRGWPRPAAAAASMRASAAAGQRTSPSSRPQLLVRRRIRRAKNRSGWCIRGGERRRILVHTVAHEPFTWSCVTLALTAVPSLNCGRDPDAVRMKKSAPAWMIAPRQMFAIV